MSSRGQVYKTPSSPTQNGLRHPILLPCQAQAFVPGNQVYSASALTLLQSSDTSASTSYSVTSTAEIGAPDHLITQFPGHEPVEWHFLKKESQTALRKRLMRRDGRCVFTGLDVWEAAHLVHAYNSNWVSPANLIVRSCFEFDGLGRPLCISSAHARP